MFKPPLRKVRSGHDEECDQTHMTLRHCAAYRPRQTTRVVSASALMTKEGTGGAARGAQRWAAKCGYLPKKGFRMRRRPALGKPPTNKFAQVSCSRNYYDTSGKQGDVGWVVWAALATAACVG